jgi:hypothetical protein
MMTPRTAWRSVGLATLALLTPLLLVLVCLASGGRDFSLAFYGSLVLFLVVGLRRVSRWGHPGQVWGALAVVGIAVLAYWSVERSLIYWVGSESVAVTVRVLDDETGRPVPDASVWLGKDPFLELNDEDKEWLGDARKVKPQGTVGRTDAEGGARLEHSFMAAGTSTLVSFNVGLYLWDTLKVEAAGYQMFHERLSKLTGPGSGAYGMPLPPVQVRLKKGGGEGRPSPRPE